MKLCRICSALLALILLACLFGVQGQYTIPNSGYSIASPSATQNTAQYTQFYTMNTGPAPNTHISAPQRSEIADNMPTTIYFSNQMQPVPFSQYQSTPTYSGSTSLWIKGATDWSQYAAVPVGANVSLLAISPTGGSGLLNLVDANGQTYSYNYFFFPNSSELTFYGDIPGRHTMSFVAGGVSSNPVVIDVTGTIAMTYAPTNNYYPPVSNYSGYYNPYSYNSYSALDYIDAMKANQKLYNYNPSEWGYWAGIYLNGPYY